MCGGVTTILCHAHENYVMTQGITVFGISVFTFVLDSNQGRLQDAVS